MAETPRYQVFISSTYKDLVTARAEVQDAILRLKHFPIGMEFFPASGDTPWELIEQVIAESDYYVLIIGGRYGSTDANGISFTEREYDLALKLGKRILPFLHANPDEISRGDTDGNDAAWERLIVFRKKVQDKHHCNSWHTPQELKALVLFSLLEETARHPMPGWIRNRGIDTEELLQRLAELQIRFDVATTQLQALKQSRLDSGFQDDTLSLNSRFVIDAVCDGRTLTLETTVGALFLRIGPQIIAPTKKSALATKLYRFTRGLILSAESSGEIDPPLPDIEKRDRIEIVDDLDSMIALEFISRDLMRVSLQVFPNESIELGSSGISNTDSVEECWQLSDKGSKILLKMRKDMAD